MSTHWSQRPLGNCSNGLAERIKPKQNMIFWWFTFTQAIYRCTDGAIKVRSSCRRWNSYAVNEISWIFYCFFFGRLFFGLHGLNKLALASILVSCDGRREFMRMSSDPSILNRRQQLGASSRKHRGVDWALKIQLTIWISGNSDRGKLHLLFQRVNNKQTDYCCPSGYLGLICVATLVNL